MAYICSANNLPKVGDTITKIEVLKTVVNAGIDGIPQYTGDAWITFSNGYKAVSAIDFRGVEIEPADMEEFLQRRQQISERRKADRNNDISDRG